MSGNGPTDEAGARLSILRDIEQLNRGEQVESFHLGPLADGTGWYWELVVRTRVGNTPSIEWADRNRDPSQEKARAAVVMGAKSWGAAAPAEAREEGPVATALALIPDDGLPDRVGEHFRVVTVCGHCGEIWSEVAAIHQQDTDRAAR